MKRGQTPRESNSFANALRRLTIGGCALALGVALPVDLKAAIDVAQTAHARLRETLPATVAQLAQAADPQVPPVERQLPETPAAAPPAEPLPYSDNDQGILGTIQDWLARANREYQGTVIRELSLPPGGRDDAIAQKLEEEKRAEEARKAEADRKRAEELAKAVSEVPIPKAPETGSSEADADMRREREKLEAEATRIENERKAAESKRLADEAARVEAARKDAEAKRIAAEQAKAEAERKAAEEKRLADEKRVADEKAKAEADRKAAEEKRLADEKAKADAERKAADAKRLADENAQAEAQRKVADEKRRADELAKAEADRKAAEAKAAEAKAAEAKAAEAKRVADEQAAAAKRAADEKAKADAAAAAAAAAAKPAAAPEKSAADAPKPAPPVKIEPAPAAPEIAASAERPSNQFSGLVRERPSAIPRPGAVKRSAMRNSGGKCRYAGRKIKPPGRYTVKRGDNLWRIAKRHYGLGRLYRTIYRANRRIIRDADLIYPCQRVYIPKKKRRR